MLQSSHDGSDTTLFARYGMTKFSDLTKEEFKKLYLQKPLSQSRKSVKGTKPHARNEKLSKVDW